MSSGKPSERGARSTAAPASAVPASGREKSPRQPGRGSFASRWLAYLGLFLTVCLWGLLLAGVFQLVRSFGAQRKLSVETINKMVQSQEIISEKFQSQESRLSESLEKLGKQIEALPNKERIEKRFTWLDTKLGEISEKLKLVEDLKNAFEKQSTAGKESPEKVEKPPARPFTLIVWHVYTDETRDLELYEDLMKRHFGDESNQALVVFTQEDSSIKKILDTKQSDSVEAKPTTPATQASRGIRWDEIVQKLRELEAAKTSYPEPWVVIGVAPAQGVIGWTGSVEGTGEAAPEQSPHSGEGKDTTAQGPSTDAVSPNSPQDGTQGLEKIQRGFVILLGEEGQVRVDRLSIPKKKLRCDILYLFCPAKKELLRSAIEGIRSMIGGA